MIDIEEISVEQAKAKLATGEAAFLDFRDPTSYELGHIDGAIFLDGSNVGSYITHADKKKTHIIYCYHGNSSKSVTAFFKENGFESVYSMAGGYAAWKS